MNQELEEQLFNDFPLLFRKDHDMKNSLMGCGFECGDGWYELIRQLCKDIYPHVVKYKKNFPSDEYICPTVLQVKEKFGELRFYLDFASDEIWNLTERALQKSREICEVCGKPGKIDYENRWYKSRCEQHRNQ